MAANDILINKSGLVVNAYRDAEGRGAYFPGSAGTSEGQFLFVLGCLEAYKATGRAAARSLGRRTLLPILSVIYRGAAVPLPLDITATNSFAPHWLFNAKYPFTSAQVHLNRQFTFTNGVATIPAVPGEPFRQVFGARSADSSFLWENPFSDLRTGVAYKIVSAVAQPDGSVVVTVNQAINGPAFISYSTVSGPIIQVGQNFEAWPDWRQLEAGEIACAVDVLVWAHKTFKAAYDVLGGSTWLTAAQSTAMQARIAFDVNDSRDWIKPSIAKNPFAEGSMFSYVNRAPAPDFSSDAEGRITVTAQAGEQAGEIQIGNASRKDFYGEFDRTKISLGARRSGVASGTMKVTFFIDPEQTYSEANRYAVDIEVPITADGAVKEFDFGAADFKNPAGGTIPAGMPVYTVGLDIRQVGAFVLTLERIRQTPPRETMYYPGAIPFTANFQGDPAKLIDWRGPVYAGYQSPEMWRTVGEEFINSLNQYQPGHGIEPEFLRQMYDSYARTDVQLLSDAQDQYVLQTGQTMAGPFAPVFYFNRADAVQYGPANTFGWDGPDPNTKWGGYQYRPMVELCEMHGNTPSVIAGRAAARKFLDWLADSQNWLPLYPGSLEGYNNAMDSLLAFDTTQGVLIPEGPALGPPTDFPKGPAEINYFEPHMAALILRAVVYYTNGDPAAMTPEDQIIVNKAYRAFQASYTPTGAMQGTFTSGQQDGEWFGFWHGEIMTTLAKFIPFARSAGWGGAVTETTKWLDGMLLFAQSNIETENTPVTPTDPLDPDNPHPLPGYPDQIGDPQEPDPLEFEDPMLTTPVNWAAPVKEEITFSTEITTSESGREQRMAMRAECRRAMTYRFAFKDGERQKVETMLHKFQNRTILLPQWHMARTIMFAQAGTLNIIGRSEFPDFFQVGGDVILSYLRRFFRAKIRAVIGDQIILTNPVARDWPEGTKIVPAFPAMVSDSVDLSHQTSLVAESAMKFSMPPQTDVQRLPFSLPRVTFTVEKEGGVDTREVVVRRANWATLPTSTFTWDYIKVENRSGPTRVLNTSERGAREFSATWVFTTDEDCQELLGMLNRLKGRHRACWMPSGQSDLRLNYFLPSVLNVAANSFTRSDMLILPTTAVCIYLRDGTVRTARVKSVEGDGLAVGLVLDRAVAVGFDMPDVLKVSLMYRVRQSNDSATISWLTDKTGQLSAEFVTVNDDYQRGKF
jgi:hypothetical protein